LSKPRSRMLLHFNTWAYSNGLH